MKFNKLVAVLAITTLAVQANAQGDTTVIMNSTNSSASTSQAVQQPTTVVEAAPVSDSKADLMRKARQNEEIKTEQKIVEKLEESRLKEEQQRAERLFGNKLDAAPAAAVVPVVAEEKKEEVKKEEPKEVAPTPAQVTIEKIEIVQPKEEPIKEEKIEPAAVSKIEVEEEKPVDAKDSFFVGGLLGVANYQASNVKSNYALGFSVGMNFKTNFVLEGSFLYSNHTVDTYWQAPLYRDLDQMDFGVAGKYYILPGKLKPYLGASLTYINRKYTDRIMGWNGQSYNTNQSEETNAINGGLLGGVDYQINEKFLIGGGLDYNMNISNQNNFLSQYQIPQGVTPLEEVDYYTVKINAKLTF